MKYPAFVEHNGKKYMNTKTAADNWKLKTDTVTKYCSAGKIPNAFKYYEKRWYIPIESIKPLTDEEIRKFLVLTLQLKNKPSLKIDRSIVNVDVKTITMIYRYLVYCEMIENFEIEDASRVPYEVVLTQKGLEFATSFKKEKIKNFENIVKDWLPIVINATQLAINIAQHATSV